MLSILFVLHALVTLFLAGLALAGNSSDSDTHITCASSVANDPEFAWWNNKNEQNPCVVLQNLLRECDPTHTIHLMPQSPLQAPDICESSSGSNSSSTSKRDNDDPDGNGAGGPDAFIPCCCNTAAYALREACWSCQQGRTDPIKPDRRPTFREYLQCPKSVSKNIFKNAGVPKWAFIAIDPDSTWSFNSTKAAATMPSMNMMMEGGGILPPPNITSSVPKLTPSSPAQQSNGETTSEHTMIMVAAIVGGVLSGLAAVALALGIVICVRRRRRRLRRAPVAAWAEHMEWPPGCCPLEAGAAGLSPSPSEKTALPYYSSRLPSPKQDMEEEPARPRPSLGRGKAAHVLGVASWRSDLAREPHIPRARETLDVQDIEFADAGETRHLKLSDPRVSESFGWSSPIAHVTPSMYNAPLRSPSPPLTIPSFANTHSFSI